MTGETPPTHDNSHLGNGVEEDEEEEEEEEEEETRNRRPSLSTMLLQMTESWYPRYLNREERESEEREETEEEEEEETWIRMFGLSSWKPKKKRTWKGTKLYQITGSRNPKKQFKREKQKKCKKRKKQLKKKQKKKKETVEEEEETEETVEEETEETEDGEEETEEESEETVEEKTEVTEPKPWNQRPRKRWIKKFFLQQKTHRKQKTSDIDDDLRTMTESRAPTRPKKRTRMQKDL